MKVALSVGAATLLVSRLTIYLGDISYPLFLFQIPLLMVLEYQIETARSLLPLGRTLGPAPDLPALEGLSPAWAYAKLV